MNNPATGINEKVQSIEFENEKKILEKFNIHFWCKLTPIENLYKPIIKNDLHLSFTKTSRSWYIILNILGKKEKSASSFYKRTIFLIKLGKECRQRKLKANSIYEHLCQKHNFCIYAKISCLQCHQPLKKPLVVKRCDVPPFIPWPCQSLLELFQRQTPPWPYS